MRACAARLPVVLRALLGSCDASQRQVETSSCSPTSAAARAVHPHHNAHSQPTTCSAHAPVRLHPCHPPRPCASASWPAAGCSLTSQSQQGPTGRQCHPPGRPPACRAVRGSKCSRARGTSVGGGGWAALAACGRRSIEMGARGRGIGSECCCSCFRQAPERKHGACPPPPLIAPPHAALCAP